MIKALFLDRDGVINVHDGYTYRIEDFRFKPGIFEICRKYLNQGYKIFVISNQAGIAKGIFLESDFLLLTDWMIEKFRDEGITIEKVYYCPHHPAFTGPCTCRKPEPGMILQAVSEFGIDIKKSLLIGDNESDIEAGRRAGIPEEGLLFSAKDTQN